MASDVRAKSSFCGFTDIVGGGTVGFNRVTADSNVEGATIDGGTGLITVGAEASYQVNKILLRTLGRCMFILVQKSITLFMDKVNINPWTNIATV